MGIQRVIESNLNEEILQTLVNLLPTGRLRERYSGWLSGVNQDVAAPLALIVQAEADLVVMQYQLNVESGATPWLIPEMLRTERQIRQLQPRNLGS